MLRLRSAALRGTLACLVLAPVSSIAAHARPHGDTVVEQRVSTPEEPQAVAAAKAARAALTAGRPADAVRLADEGLAKNGGSRELAAVKIEGLIAADKLPDALKAYDARYRVVSQDDLELLGLLGRAELWRTAKVERASLAADALAALASKGDAGARRELQKRAASGGAAETAIFAVEALARLGDEAAVSDFLRQAGKTEGGRRVEALESLSSFTGQKGAAVEAFVRQSLESPDSAVQGAAADAAAALGLTGILPDLQKRYVTTHPMARLSLTLAMARLGDAGARERVRGALQQSPAVSVRLRAATVLRDLGEQSWVEAVRPIMADADKLNAVLAAELLLPSDHLAAWKALVDATVDPNPVIRAETARIMSADPKGDRPFLRTFLSDASAQVRLPAARALAGATASSGRQSSK